MDVFLKVRDNQKARKWLRAHLGVSLPESRDFSHLLEQGDEVHHVTSSFN